MSNKDRIKWIYNLNSPPDRRRDDPQRNSEAEVYDLEAVPEAPELDFYICFEDRAWFCLQVKAGR